MSLPQQITWRNNSDHYHHIASQLFCLTFFKTPQNPRFSKWSQTFSIDWSEDMPHTALCKCLIVYIWINTIQTNINRTESVRFLTCKYLFVSDWSQPSNLGRRPKLKSTSLPLSPACANSWWILTVTSWATLEDTGMLLSENESLFWWKMECEIIYFPCTSHYSASITISFIYRIFLRMWKAKPSQYVSGFCSSTYYTCRACF